MIEREKTKERFGYYPEDLPETSTKLIVYRCSLCGKLAERKFYRYKKGVKCLACFSSPVGREKLTKQDIIFDIQRVVKLLGHQPTVDEYDEFGNHSSDTVYKKFNKTWKEVLSDIGYKVKRRSGDSYTYEQAAKDLKLVKEKLGHIPGYTEYQKNGHITVKALKRATKSTTWADVVKKVFRLDEEIACHFQIGKTNTKPVEHHLQRLRDFAKELGHTPSSREASTRSLHKLKYKLNTDWKGVLQAAGLSLDKLPGIAKALYVTDKDLIKDIRDVFRKSGICPTAGDYQLHGKYNLHLVQNRFGNWVKALEAAGFELQERYQRAKSIEKPIEYYLEKLRTLAKLLGKSPTSSQAEEHGIYSHKLTKRLNTDWLGVLQAAGLDIETLPVQTKMMYLNKDNKLTYRQQQVLALVAKGHTSKQIAYLLSITEHSVELHRMKIRKNLELSDLKDLIQYALDSGLIILADLPHQHK